MKKIIVFLMVFIFMVSIVGMVSATPNDFHNLLIDQTKLTGSWYDKLKMSIGLQSVSGDISCCDGCQPTTPFQKMNKGYTYTIKCTDAGYGAWVNVYTVTSTGGYTAIKEGKAPYVYTCPTTSTYGCAYDCYTCDHTGTTEPGLDNCQTDKNCQDYASSLGIEDVSLYECIIASDATYGTCRQKCNPTWNDWTCKDNQTLTRTGTLNVAGCTVPPAQTLDCGNLLCQDGKCVEVTIPVQTGTSETWVSWETVGNIPSDQISKYKCTSEGIECKDDAFCVFKQTESTMSLSSTASSFISYTVKVSPAINYNHPLATLIEKVKSLVGLGYKVEEVSDKLDDGVEGFNDNIAPELQEKEGVCVSTTILEETKEVAKQASETAETLGKPLTQEQQESVSDILGGTETKCVEPIKYEQLVKVNLGEEDIKNAETNKKESCCDVLEPDRKLIFVDEVKYEELFGRDFPESVWDRIGANPSLCVSIATTDDEKLNQGSDLCAWTTSVPDGFLGSCGNAYAIVIIVLLIVVVMISGNKGEKK